LARAHVIALEEAWERLFALLETGPRAVETVPVDESAGRYLATPLVARRTQPARDLSVMDGLATAGEGPWRIVGESRAGAPFEGILSAGEAVRIATGAAVPAGAGGIVLLEDGVFDGYALSGPAPDPLRWIRRRGFDFAEGATILDPGTLLGPDHLALARAAGHGALAVGRRPIVAVLECGDELVADPVGCPPDRLPASNGAMVAAMIASVGGVARRIGPLPDDRGQLARALSEAADAEVVVTTAGASVGEHDHVRGVLADIGADIAFWRVAIRPGKPFLVARNGRQLVLGLPGNPNSSYVTAFLFVLPLLRAMQGAARPLPAPIKLELGEPLPAGEERREFRRARLVESRAVPLRERDSSALATLAVADLLIDRPALAPPAPAGAMLPCYLLRFPEMA
jgi:molybdopterin molybdotransferase